MTMTRTPREGQRSYRLGSLSSVDCMYVCVFVQLFSSALVQQHDEDSESTALWGFETSDVKKEFARASRLVQQHIFPIEINIPNYTAW